MSDEVLVSVDGNVGVLTLNRPDKFNCISSALVRSLNAGMDELESNADVRVVVLRGAGKVFCTGADLTEILETRKDQAALQDLLDGLLRALRRFETSPLPVIAAVHGMALAGGLEIMMACDVVFAAKSARIGDQHSQYGLVPGGGNSQRLTRVLGRRRALDLMFSARWLDAEEAREWGLINYVVEDEQLLDAAMEYASKVAGHSSDGLSMIKRMADEGLDMTLPEALTLEVQLAAEGLRSDDSSEGLQAFQERRAPNFRKRVIAS